MKKAKCDYPDITSTVPSTDTTGLMPTIPQDEAELEAYRELAGIEIPKE